MTGLASSLVLGFLLSTAYGAAFHLVMGGPATRLLVYLPAAWLGFILGHFAGNVLQIDLFNLGALHLFSASLGSWVVLIFSWWLAGTSRR